MGGVEYLPGQMDIIDILNLGCQGTTSTMMKHLTNPRGLHKLSQNSNASSNHIHVDVVKALPFTDTNLRCCIAFWVVQSDQPLIESENPLFSSYAYMCDDIPFRYPENQIRCSF